MNWTILLMYLFTLVQIIANTNY